MNFEQKWLGCCVSDGKSGEFFNATVPGNIQADYAAANGFPDVNFSDTCKKFKSLENCGWIYKSELEYDAEEGDRVFFVTKGIDYEYDVILNSKKILHHTGMFSEVEIDITDELKNGKLLEIYIYPHPKREGADECRDQADQSCKPAVGYGWDWHPRLLVSGIWNETYIETRNSGTITDCRHSYELSQDLSTAEVCFDIKCEEDTKIELWDMSGKLIYSGKERRFTVENVNLWWCNGQGTPYLYKWQVSSASDTKCGKIGFRKISLEMNGDSWKYPDKFPKSRSNPPITVCLNGRNIFAKGSNWINPEIFIGTITRKTYENQLRLAKDANMNILRCWGGAIVNKEPFFELCDELGLMVWQEFPLACNNYRGTKEYLRVLKQEAIAIIKRVNQHVCHILWCGGNELFNCWSMMTDQSPALRLLNKLCYEYDENKPFIMTAPLMGMGHGPYSFSDFSTGKNVFELFRDCSNTAYTEFGISSIKERKYLEKIFSEEEINNPAPGTAWETHHAFNAFRVNGWLCADVIDEIFGKQDSLDDYIEKSHWLQCEGLKASFEEARRQKPNCSMAINWCYNEPWITAAGLALLNYPDSPKKAYYAVKDALRPVMPSLRIENFNYTFNEVAYVEMWLLNDSTDEVSDTLSLYVEADGEKRHIADWNTGVVCANTNAQGHKLRISLPYTREQKIILTVEGKCGKSEYVLLLKEPKDSKPLPHALNM